MTDRRQLLLPRRGVLAVSGPDARSFLQGLISNDVERVTPGRAIHAALLTAQGRFLHEFFVAELDGRLLLDCEADRRNDLLTRLKRFRLRAQVTVEDVSDAYAVLALWGDAAEAEPGVAELLLGGVAFVDPRLAALGWRAILPRARLGELDLPPADEAAYDRLRLELGVPDGSRDLPVDKALLLESGFDELNGVDWKKGCYVGQELTARTKYRGLVRRRLLPVAIEGEAPPPGTPVLQDGKDAGEMRSARDGLGLALLRLDAVTAAEDGARLEAGGARLVPHRPGWARF